METAEQKGIVLEHIPNLIKECDKGYFRTPKTFPLKLINVHLYISKIFDQ